MNHDIGLTAAKITFKVKYMPNERLTVFECKKPPTRLMTNEGLTVFECKRA